MPFFGPPSDDEIEKIRVSRYTNRPLFEWELMQLRLKNRYGLRATGGKDTVEVYESLQQDKKELEERIARLQREKAAAEKYLGMLEDDYEEALEFVTEARMNELIDKSKPNEDESI